MQQCSVIYGVVEMGNDNERPSDLLAVIETMKLTQTPTMDGILSKLDYEERTQILDLLKVAYLAGSDAENRRTGKLMARIFGAFVGVTPGVDSEEFNNLTAGERIKNMVKMLAGGLS